MNRFVFVFSLLLVATPATAQEAGQAGLSAGYPGTIGIVWHVSDSLAFRPDFLFSHSSSEVESGVTEGSSSNYGVGVSALWYVGQVRDNVRVYVAPGFSYQRSTTETESRAIFVGQASSVSSIQRRGNNYTASGLFGVQYSPSRRISVFGEAGLAYTTGDTTTDYTGGLYVLPVTKSSSTAWGTRTAVGVVIYFN